VVTCSAVTNAGLDIVWEQIERHREALEATGEWAARRLDQQVDWMWAMVEDRVIGTLRSAPRVRDLVAPTETEVRAGTLSPTAAADRLIAAYSTATD
jgi:LAO/AO transport system kinase